ncbi:MAG: putative quinol monooxygenase [Bacilli bacterium]
MNSKLIDRVASLNAKELYYNTASLQVTKDNDYSDVYNKFLGFVSETIKEDGCIEFFVAPSNLEKNEVMLWEVWKSEKDYQDHLEAQHTKEFLELGLVELLWNEPLSWGA